MNGCTAHPFILLSPPFYIMKRTVATLLFSLLFINIFCQTTYRAMFYNVENLFDTFDNPHKNDDEFLPHGTMRWTNWKYWEKLKNITRVITAVGEMQPPSLVGLCEIENDSVIHYLTKRSPLRAQGYEYIVTDSPDERGINVALLYQPHHFNLIQKNEYRIKFSSPNARPSRNILHATGIVLNGDTLDVFVLHPPSRYGGQLESEPQRIDVAQRLRHCVDSLFDIRTKANILIMGDFNDYPNNKSLSHTLDARSLRSPHHDMALYNMFRHRMKEKNFGSYFFQGRWGILDQVIVSGNMLHPHNSIHIKDNEAHIFKADFLLEKDATTGQMKPHRTYLGPRYIGGFSDHLPIYIDLIVQ